MMAYTSKRGRRPSEYASKSAHSHVINNPTVQEFLNQCHFPTPAEDVDLSGHEYLLFKPVTHDPIRHVIAVDGGYDEISVRIEFPSASIAFFQFGALTFSVEDLERLDAQTFIDPDDIAKLKRIQRLQFTLPIRNVSLRSEKSLTDSVRKAVFDLFHEDLDGDSLIKTLKWFIFNEYTYPTRSVWYLARCPKCEIPRIPLDRKQMSKDYTFTCIHCSAEIYLTDVFRLHEAVDDALGAGGILGYVTTTFEQIVIVHLIRLIHKLKPDLLKQILFIKDGPLAFFGQTANMHQPMRELTRYLFANYNLYLVGLEKSGAFVEHADEIANLMQPGTILLLDNEYIYKYIIPGKADPSNPYGGTTYYSNKLIYKTRAGEVYVASLPTEETLVAPKVSDLRNLQTILTNLEKLKCDMYDSALVPVALVNKLVSLSNHPSSRILQRFAVESLSA